MAYSFLFRKVSFDIKNRVPRNIKYLKTRIFSYKAIYDDIDDGQGASF